jgi:hypothetical protein
MHRVSPVMLALRSPVGPTEREKLLYIKGKISCQAHPINRVYPTNKFETNIKDIFLAVWSPLNVEKLS